MADTVVKIFIDTFLKSDSVPEARSVLETPSTAELNAIEGEISTLENSSVRWEDCYTTVNTLSDSWDGGGSNVSYLSGNWESTYTTVSNLSSTWDYQGDDLKALSGNWEQTYTTVQANSGNWENGYNNLSNYLPTSGGSITGSLSVLGTLYADTLSTINVIYNVTTVALTGFTVSGPISSNSSAIFDSISATNYYGLNDAAWDNSYTTVQTNSASWGYQGMDIKGLSGDWENSYNTVSSLSSTWGYQGTDLKALSGNWERTYTTVNGSSATWNYQGTDLKALSSNWQNTYSTVQANSAAWALSGSAGGSDVSSLSGNWQNTYTTVQTNSANWENPQIDLTTYLPVSGGTITGNLSVGGILYTDTLSATTTIYDTTYVTLTGLTVNGLISSNSTATFQTISAVNYYGLPNIINVVQYGVIGDGVTDVSQSMRHALSSNPTGGSMFFPAGVYNFDSYVLIPNNNLTILLDNNATLRTTNRIGLVPADVKAIFIVGSNNFTLVGGTLSGDWDMSYQGTGRVQLNREYSGSIIRGLLCFTDYFGNRSVDVENIRVENVTFRRGEKGCISIYANTASSGKFRNFYFHNNRFLESAETPIQITNYKQTLIGTLSAYERFENITIRNNTFITTSKSQAHWNGYNTYNPQGMGLFNSQLRARDGVFITSIIGTNRVSISGLNFDDTSIGYIHKIPPEYIGPTNRANGGSLYSLLSSSSTTSSISLGLTSVAPNGTAEYVLLSSAFKPSGTYFERWTPAPITFTTASQLSGSNINGEGFQMIEHSLAYDSSFAYPLGGTSNFIGGVGPYNNLIIENNYFDDNGKHCIEMYLSQHSENTVVRNNIFKNIPYYVYSFGGVNTVIENNTYEDCSPVLELYGTQLSIQNNYWKSGGVVLALGYTRYGTDIVNFSNNFINARPEDLVSLSDGVGYEVHSVVVENNVIQYPNGRNAALPGTSSIFEFKFTDNLLLRNNTISITGPVSGFYWSSIPPLFTIGGKNIMMENNSFLLSGFGGTEGSGYGPLSFGIFNSLFNSRIYNNNSNCKLPVKMPTNIPIWGFNANGIYEAQAPKVALFEGGSYVSYPLSGYPGYECFATGAAYDSGPAYPTAYNIGDIYLINPVTDFTANSASSPYLSAWNNHRNQVAKYAGSGNWTYYDIADIVHYDTLYAYHERPLDAFINSEYPIVNFGNKAFLINVNNGNCVFSNVTFENNNFTFYDSVSSNYLPVTKGFGFRYPMLKNFRIINNKDTVNITLPRLNLNSDYETNGYGTVLTSSTGDRYKLTVDSSGGLSSVKL